MKYIFATKNNSIILKSIVLLWAMLSALFCFSPGIFCELMPDASLPLLMGGEEAEYSDDAVLFKTENILDENLKSKINGLGAGRFEVLTEVDGDYWYKAVLYKNIDPVVLAEQLMLLPGIISAEPDYICTAESGIMDSETLDSALGLGGNALIGNARHLLCCGWQKGILTETAGKAGTGVIVAVIDTGVFPGHSDLKANIWINSGEIAGNGIDDDHNGYIDDYMGWNAALDSGNGADISGNGHGTHVSGIIAAANNSEGICGVAYNCRIMPIRSCRHNTSSGADEFHTSDEVKALEYAYNNGARVINMSYCGEKYNEAVEDEINKVSEKCVLVAAAGNSGRSTSNPNKIGFPAGYNQVIGVMSVDYDGRESGFSNYNSAGDSYYQICAPGKDIYSTYKNNGYITQSGTSMAAPFVTGIAANIIGEYPDITPAEVRERLLYTYDGYATVRQGSEKHTPGRLVNLKAALVRFLDISGTDWYRDAVWWASEQNITSGVSANYFAPDKDCTRAQIVSFLWRYYGQPDSESANPFTDVKPGSYYYNAVRWGRDKGIIYGRTDTLFDPNATCTRAEAVSFLQRAAVSQDMSMPAEDVSGPAGTFSDVSPSAYYYSAVDWASKYGIVAGTSDTLFSPDMHCSRAHIVTFLYRMSKL